MTNETFFSKFKQAWLEQWSKYSTIKKIWVVLGPILSIVLVVCFFATDLSAKIFNTDEYKAYEYAIECVEDKLKFPNTAEFPSFKECTIKKSVYSTQIIQYTYSYSNTGGKSMEYAWDVSGYGTCEDAMARKRNYSFTVTVVLSKSGDLWCYKCETSQ